MERAAEYAPIFVQYDTRTCVVMPGSQQRLGKWIPADISINGGQEGLVTVTFHEDENPVSWTFARELLSLGLYEPMTGCDVGVSPGSRGENIAITLSAGAQGIMCIFVTSVVRSFLEEAAMAEMGLPTEAIISNEALDAELRALPGQVLDFDEDLKRHIKGFSV